MGVFMSLPIYKDDAGIWWFRKRLPTALALAYQEHSGYKTPQVKISLGTKSEAEAKLQGAEQLTKYSQLIQYLRARAHLSPEELQKARWSLFAGGLTKTIKKQIDLELIQTLQRKVEGELEGAKGRLKVSDGDEVVTPSPKFNRREMTLKEYVRYLQIAARNLNVYERMFTEQGFDPSAELRKLSQQLDDNEVNLRDFIIKAVKEARDTSKPISHAVLNSQKPTITDAIDTWIEVRDPRSRSITEWRYAVKRFTELHGDIPVDTIEDSHIVEFRKALAKIPARLPTALRDKPLPELIALADSGKLTGMGNERSPSAINKLIVAIGSILDVMLDDGVIARNPAKNKLLAKDDDGTKRPPYEIEDLRTLFTSEIYCGDYWSSPACRDDRPSHYWMPLVALFAGFRIEEISQLTVTDVRCEKGVWYISINTDYGRKYKSKAAIRDVVIHQELLKAGFLRFVNEQKKLGHKRLFHDLTKTADGRLSGVFSNWYSRYATKVGIKNNGRTFHSFRDNFSDALDNGGFSDRQIERLMGHALDGVKKNYGNGVWLRTVARQMKKMEYPELDLSHLHAFSSVENALASHARTATSTGSRLAIKPKPAKRVGMDTATA